MKHESTSPDDVVVECDLPHAPEKVWRAITDQDLLGRWLAPADLRPEVGARFRLQPVESAPGAAMIDCEVIEAVPHRTLRWRQTEKEGSENSSVESIVTFELLPNRSGTHLRVIHDQFRRVAIEARTADSNVVPFERRKASTRATRTRRPTIVCCLGALRRAA